MLSFNKSTFIICKQLQFKNPLGGKEKKDQNQKLCNSKAAWSCTSHGSIHLNSCVQEILSLYLQKFTVIFICHFSRLLKYYKHCIKEKMRKDQRQHDKNGGGYPRDMCRAHYFFSPCTIYAKRDLPGHVGWPTFSEAVISHSQGLQDVKCSGERPGGSSSSS